MNIITNRILFNSYLIVIILFCSHVHADDSLSVIRYYVWDFHSPNIDSAELLKSFTDDFEEALIKTKIGTALQRRQFEALFQQKEKERRIRNLDAIPRQTLKSLHVLRANVVVFGEVIDDKDSGQLKISVNFESFDSRILAKESILLLRGKRYDAESREDTMDKLVLKVFLTLKVIPTSKSIFQKAIEIKDQMSTLFSGGSHTPTTANSLADPSCGGQVLSVSNGSTVPLSGNNAILRPANSDCLFGPPGENLKVYFQLCNNPMTGVSAFEIRHSSNALDGRNTKVFSKVEMSFVGNGSYSFRPMFESKKSFGNLRVSTKGLPIKGIKQLRLDISGKPGYQLKLCSININ